MSYIYLSQRTSRQIVKRLTNKVFDCQYIFTGTIWVQISSTVTHNNLSGLQGGITSEYYHLTNTQHSNLHVPVTIAAHPLSMTDQNISFNYNSVSLGINTSNQLYVIDDGHTHATQYAPLVHGVDQYYLPHSDSLNKNSWAKTTLAYTPNDGGIDKWYSTTTKNNRLRLHADDNDGFVTVVELGARYSSGPAPTRTADWGGLQIMAYDVNANNLLGAICELNSNFLTRLHSENSPNLLIDAAGDYPIYLGTNAKIRAKIDSTASMNLYNKNSTYALLVSHADSTHGITDILPTTARFGILTGLPVACTAGYTRIIGINCEGGNPDQVGLMFEGIVPDDSSSIAHVFDGAAGSGTGRAALTAGNIARWTNNSATRMTLDYTGALTCTAGVSATTGEFSSTLQCTTLQCDTLRVDQTPATATITPDKVIDINCNGTIYQIAVKQKP